MSETTHTALLRYYAAYLAAKTQVGKLATGPSRDLVATQLADAGDAVHKQLQDHEIEETAPLTGELRAGSALTDTGSFAGASSNAVDTSSAEALAHIAWSTTHTGAIDKLSGRDLAVAGLVGLQPAMTVVKPASGTLEAKYQQALVIGAGLEVNGFAGRSETGAIIRAGFVRLGELAQVVDRNGQAELALPAGTSGKVAPYFEAGMKFSLFDRPMALVHLTHTELSPRLNIEAAYRRDARFKDLSSPGQQDLIVCRLMVDGLEIVDKRTGVGNKTFVASFGFEYQKGREGLPYGFSFIIKGDLDLLKALSGGHTDTQ